MDVTIDQEQDAVVATVVGEMDADNCAELGRHLLDRPDGARRLVVDLSGLTFIDSSGISELLRVGETLSERGQTLEIRSPSPAVRRVLEITGLLGHFGLA